MCPPAQPGGTPATWAGLHRDLGIPPDYAAGRRMTPFPEAEETCLVEVGRNADGRSVRLIPPAAAAWRTLRQSAGDAGLVLVPVSGFRSVARQAEIIRARLAAGTALTEVLRSIAAPGFSEHHTGRAIDIASPDHPALEETFAATATFRWLQTHAAAHGFHLTYPAGNLHGIVYEPWHWCWREAPGRAAWAAGPG